eukprot:746230-Hanusia_phi.AAC.5
MGGLQARSVDMDVPEAYQVQDVEDASGKGESRLTEQSAPKLSLCTRLNVVGRSRIRRRLELPSVLSDIHMLRWQDDQNFLSDKR